MRGVELTPDRPLGRVVELARVAERAGFDAVLTSCHYNNRDHVIALDRIAAATESVRIGPGVANPYETHPVTLAAQLATLDEVSGGRAVFGIGAGDRSTLANLGVERERPLRRVLETIDVSRRLWAGERVDHEGTFTARDAGLNFGAGTVPVYVGAQGPDMLRMAGKHADGVLINASHRRDLEWAAKRVAEGRTDRDPGLGPVDRVAFASVSVADSGAEARTAARRPVAFIAAGARRPVLDRHGIDPDVAEAIADYIGAGRFSEAFDAVTDPMLAAFSVAGTADQVVGRLEAMLEVVDGVVVGSPLGPDEMAAIERLGAALDGR